MSKRKGVLYADYNKKCDVCGNSPVPVVMYATSVEDLSNGLCAVCIYGEAKMLDPAEWEGNTVTDGEE